MIEGLLTGGWGQSGLTPNVVTREDASGVPKMKLRDLRLSSVLRKVVFVPFSEFVSLGIHTSIYIRVRVIYRNFLLLR